MLAIDNMYKNDFTNTLKDMVLMWEGGLSQGQNFDNNSVMTIEDEVKMKNPQLCALVLVECITSPTRYVVLMCATIVFVTTPFKVHG